MCTVTYIPTLDGIYLTSNRDENTRRSQALPPQVYVHNGYRVIYPQDPVSGGSWIAMKENGDLAVLLNGAFTKHNPTGNYRKSRGAIFLELIASKDGYSYFTEMGLWNIEPFTLILWQQKQLWECRWDGQQKHSQLLNPDDAYIWSSCTLYDTDAVQKRAGWFKEWLSVTDNFDITKIIHFHQTAGAADPYNALVMNRQPTMQTLSITCIQNSSGTLQMRYKDLQAPTDVITNFQPVPLLENESFFNRWAFYFKKLRIRIQHWEYWPMHLVYGPIYWYWFWLSLKARSFFFFSAANPSIAYAGFVQEKKSDIYKLIPQAYYPKTLLCTTKDGVAFILKQLQEQGMPFPLIAKPDMGEKGMQVQLLHSIPELQAYLHSSRVAFLLQTFIAYKEEVGIFYYRIPGEKRGHISGMVGKEFVTVTGDGTATILSLLKKEDRYLLQLPALIKSYGRFLHTVLPHGEKYVLVPYGNHARGAKFIDVTHKLTDSLLEVIDQVCQQIPGFYYGRLDIKFNNWQDLYEGKHFCIIELNGAGSEPTHMYDPAHSLGFAWKEICKHWRLLYKISSMNAKKKKIPLLTTINGIKMLKNHFKYLQQIENT